MPRNMTVSIPAATWTQLTADNITALRVQNLCGYTVYIMATVGAVAPTSVAGAILLNPLQGVAANVPLADLFPGVVGANRVYGYCDVPAAVSVSHV